MTWEPKVQKKSAWNSAPVEKSIFPKQRGSQRDDGTNDASPTGISKGHGFNLLNLKTPDSPPPVQAKLTVGAPGDKYEQEADAMAAQVMSMPEPATSQAVQRMAPEEQEEEVQTKPLADSITPLVQREAMPEEEEEIQTKPLNASIQRDISPEEEEAVQMKPALQRAEDGSFDASSSLESRLSSSKGGGSPLPDDVQGFMEPRFGNKFDNVRVHTGSEAVQMNKELGAQAFTHGSDIYYGAGKAPGNNELTAHELTHVVQQVELIQPYLQCYQIEGPWNWNDPVHETLTQEALRKAGVVGKKDSYKSKKAWEYVRGVFWNDDPLGQLFYDSVSNPNNNTYSSGVAWTKNFKKAEKQAEAGKQFDSSGSLLERSHFGDLQFIHGMASEDGENPNITLSHIMMWAEFCYKIAIGQIPGTTKISEVDVPNFSGYFPKQKDQTISQFFGIDLFGDVKQRAAGSLLHMIQDSYASGHVQRETQVDGSKGAIRSFHSYAHQDHDKHGSHDKFSEGYSMQEKIRKTPGAQDAIYIGTEILKFIKDCEPWDTVKYYLEFDVFNLAEDSEKAEPGESYKKSLIIRSGDVSSEGLPPGAGYQ